MFGKRKTAPADQPLQNTPQKPVKHPIFTAFKIVKLLIFISLIITILAFLLYHFSEPLLRTNIQNIFRKNFNTEINFEDIGFNIFTRSIVLEDISVKNPSPLGGKNIIEIEQISIKPELIPLLEKKLIISRVSVDTPLVNLYKLSNGEMNWNALWQKEQIQDNKPPKIFPIKELLIKNGAIHYTLQFESGKTATAEMQGIFIYFRNHLPPLSYIEHVPLFTEVRGRGYIPSSPKGTITILGNMNVFEREKSFLGNTTMEDISLTYFNDFYPENSQVKVTEGHFSLNSQIECLHDQLTAKPDVTVKNLRLKLSHNYTTGDIFKLPVLLVVDFFDLYKEEFKFSFEVGGYLNNPEFKLDQVLPQKLSEVISESITKTITGTPGMIGKFGINTVNAVRKLGTPFAELFKGLKGE